MYVLQIEHLSACALSGGLPIISGRRGRANIAVICAEIESARSGITVAHA